MYPAGRPGFDLNGQEAECGNPCTVTMDRDVEAFIQVHLRQWLTLDRTGSGTGTVKLPESEFFYGRPLACGTDCVLHFNQEFIVPLEAVPDAGSRFVGWPAGSCVASATGDPRFCGVDMQSDRTVTATFEKLPTTDPGGGGHPGTGGTTTGGTGLTAGGNGSGGATSTTGATGTSTTSSATKLKFTVTAKRRGKTVSLTLKFRGGSTGTSSATVRLRSGKKLVAKASGKPRSGQLKLELRARKTIRKGRYRVEVSVGKTKLAPVTLRLR